MPEISDRLKQVILRQLNLDDFPIAPTTVAPEVPGWDSLRHVQILAAVEKEYNIQFRGMEVLRLKTVGELQALVDKKTS